MDRFILNMFSNVSERFGIGREDYSKCLVYHLEVESVNYRQKDWLYFRSPSSFLPLLLLDRGKVYELK